MSETLQSPSWYKVAHLRPRLRAHVRIQRQIFRGQLWYVLEDRMSGRFHRFSPTSYLVISLMDGHRSVQEVWDLACSQLDEDVVTQDDIVRLMTQLHQADVLHTDILPDMDTVSNRARKTQMRKRLMSFINPMAIRLPLVDPNEFLDATLPLARPFLSWFGALVFLGIVGYAISLAGIHWNELTNDVTDRVLASESLLFLLLTYPFVKAIHELGHGYAVKRWGGEVHEMGIMFLVFMPVPYVDASAASAFREKWRRVFVGAAGVIVEIFLAALAMIVWVNAEDALVRAFAFNVMFIGGVSTLMFNGNPLLRFDGYYVLTDLIEIPNLGNRANRYIGYLIQRYLFGVGRAVSPVTAPGERGWFFFYAIAAFCYRVFILVAIVSFVATQFFVIGVVLALWGFIMMVVFPLSKHLWFLLTSPVLRQTRGRAFAVTAGLLGAVVGVFMLVPVPYATVAEGVVWVPGDAVINAGADGEVTALMRAPNQNVASGEPIVGMSDPILDANVTILETRVAGLQRKLAAAIVVDAVETRILREELKHAEADLAKFRARQAELIVRAPRSGELVVARGEDIVGSFVRKGETIGYVVELSDPAIRVIVFESAADLVRSRTRNVQVRFAGQLDDIYQGHVVRTLPVISDQLPSPVLATVGGGQVVMDPSDPEKIRALDRVWQLEVRIDEPVRVRGLGGRTFVRFDHGDEPLVWRIYRNVRRLFLSHFNV